MPSRDLKVKSPRRILFLSISDSLASESLKVLTGTAPTPLAHGLSGVSHTLSLKTAYYEADVPIWIDILPSDASSWAEDFSGEEAEEVLAALGGYVLVLPRPVDEKHEKELKGLVEAAGKVVKGAEGRGWDGVAVCVFTKQEVVPNLELEGVGEKWNDWEDFCTDNGGWELVDGECVGGRNEFGERRGWERVREALEANNWERGLGEVDEEELKELGLNGLEEGEFDLVDGEEMRREMEGIREAIYGGGREGEDVDEEKGVEGMEELMRRMMAMRDLGADLPEAERKRFAANAVRDLMKKL